MWSLRPVGYPQSIWCDMYTMQEAKVEATQKVKVHTQTVIDRFKLGNVCVQITTTGEDKDATIEVGTESILLSKEDMHSLGLLFYDWVKWHK